MIAKRGDSVTLADTWKNAAKSERERLIAFALDLAEYIDDEQTARARVADLEALTGESLLYRVQAWWNRPA